MNSKFAMKTFAVVVLIGGLGVAAWAGDIDGKVTGMKGKSVVYVEAVAGKTFPAPKEHPVMDQKGLVFAPHIMVVLQGTTVDFLNSDTVQHNVFWTAIGSDKKAGHNLGTWPKGEKRSFTFDKAGRGAAALQCTPGNGGHTSLSAQLPILPKPTTAAITRSKTFLTAATP